MEDGPTDDGLGPLAAAESWSDLTGVSVVDRCIGLSACGGFCDTGELETYTDTYNHNYNIHISIPP